ncbi:MAG TPA: hypothetical protein VKV37_18405 [Ktedonobacteraceae bacterium]|jgi:hypothetical protein|nr:hypothetical protein [Ktedonobacteraceae bacterium]
MAQSEVARIRAQIEEECKGMRNGLYGYAITAKHDFIQARYNRLGELQDELARYVGEHQAMQEIVELYIKAVNGGDEKQGAQSSSGISS